MGYDDINMDSIDSIIADHIANRMANSRILRDSESIFRNQQDMGSVTAARHKITSRLLHRFMTSCLGELAAGCNIKLDIKSHYNPTRDATDLLGELSVASPIMVTYKPEHGPILELEANEPADMKPEGRDLWDRFKKAYYLLKDMETSSAKAQSAA